MDTIRVRGARTHNLKNIDVDLPRDKLIVITGVSGSGKSSLAFDTIYAEGQRRYVESLSSYARQFLSVMEKPDIDHIEGLSPAISIEQKSTSHNPRSTVGTITEIYDYLRLLYARAGVPHCPNHGYPLEAHTVSQMVDACLALDDGRYMLLAPIVKERKGEHHQVFEQLRAQGFTRARVNGQMYMLDQVPSLALRQKHTIDVVVDRFRPHAEMKQRLAEGFETALRLGEGLAVVERWVEPDATQPSPAGKKNKGPAPSGNEPIIFSARYACPVCNYSLSELEPRLFSFNAPVGACPECDGLGVSEFVDPERILINPKLTLSQGALAKWGKDSQFGFAIISSLARHYGFSVDTPWEKIPAKYQEIIWNGSGNDQVLFRYPRGSQRHRFSGVLANIARRYKESDNENVKEELRQFFSQQPCHVCQGARLNISARNVFVAGRPLEQIVALPVNEAFSYFSSLHLEGWRGEVAEKIVKEIKERLRFLVDVGLDYLTLDRRADTLSGGEAQRIRLASQIGAGLVGVMYVLDEPSIGLHQRDNDRLLGTLVRLRDLGNTVIVVEHDEDAIRLADHVLDIGPLAGVHGGQVVAAGTIDDILKNEQSITGQFLSGKRQIPIPTQRRPVDPQRMISLQGASGNNLKGVDLNIPVGLLTCVTGVSGSGKSTLINDTLYALAACTINGSSMRPAPYKKIEGLENFDKVVDINQSPIGRTPRSNPATYTGIFTPLRELFAQVPEARARGYTAGRFSFNVKGGRCEACQGDGMLKVEMHFLPDVYVPCDVCHGKRYNRETLEVHYKGLNIHQVLEMTVEDARGVFDAVPSVARKLDTLVEVGLGYIKLGQPATTLSGGEAQRVKLAKELSRRDTGNTLYILDEPTTGLHFYDIDHLLAVLHQLRDNGNTVVVIEHNLDVIKTADWIVDLGPEGGGGGGLIIATGTPEEVAATPHSETGRFLSRLLTPARGAPLGKFRSTPPRSSSQKRSGAASDEPPTTKSSKRAPQSRAAGKTAAVSSRKRGQKKVK